jgi:hypothetical protein
MITRRLLVGSRRTVEIVENPELVQNVARVKLALTAGGGESFNWTDTLNRLSAHTLYST